MAEYVALDLETTGLSPEHDRIIEIGAIRFDGSGREHSRFESLVRPDRPVSPGAQAVHGISDADLAEAPLVEDVLAQLLQWVGEPDELLFLAHHARFDAAFLGSAFARLGGPFPAFRFADTLSLARYRMPEAPDHKLDTLAELLGLERLGPSHRALADCFKVKGLWLTLDGPGGRFLSYSLFDPSGSEPTPAGLEAISEAINRGRHVRITYSGGSRGPGPRDITPIRIFHGGGVAYLVAFCHLDGSEKHFRLDRILTCELLEAGQIEASPSKKPMLKQGRRA